MQTTIININVPYIPVLEVTVSPAVYFWIGAEDRVVEGQYHWTSDGSLVNFTNWRFDQPNDYSSQDCITINPQGFWNDRWCFNDERLFICQWSD